MIQLFGIKLIAIFYFAGGAGIGIYMRQTVLGQFVQLEEPDPAELGMALLNFILIPCWQTLLKKSRKEADLSLASPEMKPKSLFLQGVPTNQRIALGIWGGAWAGGFLLSAMDVFS